MPKLSNVSQAAIPERSPIIILRSSKHADLSESTYDCYVWYKAVLWIRIFNIRIQIRIQPFFQYPDPGPDPDPDFLMTQKYLVQIFSKKDFCFFYISFNYLWRNSFQRDEKKRKNFTQIWNLWSVFKLPDPDPDPYIIYRSGSGSRRTNNTPTRIGIRIQESQ